MDKPTDFEQADIFQDLPLSEDTTNGRLLLAMKYIKDQMMSVRGAASKAGIDRDKLRR